MGDSAFDTAVHRLELLALGCGQVLIRGQILGEGAVNEGGPLARCRGLYQGSSLLEQGLSLIRFAAVQRVFERSPSVDSFSRLLTPRGRSSRLWRLLGLNILPGRYCLDRVGRH